MDCNLRPPEPRQPFPALITTLCQVWSRWTYPLPYYSVLLLIRYSTPWPWPLPSKICSVSSVTWWNSVPYVNAIEQSAAELLRFQCLTLWPWTCLSVALGSRIIFTQFDLQQLIRAWIIAFLCWYVMSSCDLDLWPLDIELLQHFGCHAFKLGTKFERNRVIQGWVIDDLARFCVQF